MSLRGDASRKFVLETFMVKYYENAAFTVLIGGHVLCRTPAASRPCLYEVKGREGKGGLRVVEGLSLIMFFFSFPSEN